VSLESASKVFNACGLMIGAIVTDNEPYHRQSVAEGTANLCAPAIDQYIFGGLAQVGVDDLREWYAQQRAYYQPMMAETVEEMERLLPGVIISRPEAAIYSVVDVRQIVRPGFDAQDFVLYCARRGSVQLGGQNVTLLVSPMAGFYGVDEGQPNPGRTQMRVAYVVPPAEMRLVPPLFAELIRQYEGRRV
jgi:aspartate aminotransferase